VDLGGNCAELEGAEALTALVAPDDDGAVHGCLRSLNLWQAGLGVEGAWALTYAMRERSHHPLQLCGALLAVPEGKLGGMQLKPWDAVLLSNDLVLARTLTRLDLSDNFVGVEGAAAIADALTPTANHPFNHTLTALDLSGNWLYDDSARMLAVPLTPHQDTGACLACLIHDTMALGRSVNLSPCRRSKCAGVFSTRVRVKE
jgi:hypothetical protein